MSTRIETDFATSFQSTTPFESFMEESSQAPTPHDPLETICNSRSDIDDSDIRTDPNTQFFLTKMLSEFEKEDGDDGDAAESEKAKEDSDISKDLFGSNHSSKDDEEEEDDEEDNFSDEDSQISEAGNIEEEEEENSWEEDIISQKIDKWEAEDFETQPKFGDDTGIETNANRIAENVSPPQKLDIIEEPPRDVLNAPVFENENCDGDVSSLPERDVNMVEANEQNADDAEKGKEGCERENSEEEKDDNIPEANSARNVENLGDVSEIRENEALADVSLKNKDSQHNKKKNRKRSVNDDDSNSNSNSNDKTRKRKHSKTIRHENHNEASRDGERLEESSGERNTKRRRIVSSSKKIAQKKKERKKSDEKNTTIEPVIIDCTSDDDLHISPICVDRNKEETRRRRREEEEERGENEQKDEDEEESMQDMTPEASDILRIMEKFVDLEKKKKACLHIFRNLDKKRLALEDKKKVCEAQIKMAQDIIERSIAAEENCKKDKITYQEQLQNCNESLKNAEERSVKLHEKMDRAIDMFKKNEAIVAAEKSNQQHIERTITSNKIAISESRFHRVEMENLRDKEIKKRKRIEENLKDQNELIEKRRNTYNKHKKEIKKFGERVPESVIDVAHSLGKMKKTEDTYSQIPSTPCAPGDANAGRSRSKNVVETPPYQNVKQMYECPVCKTNCVNSAITTCRHTFCSDCLKTLPICKEDTVRAQGRKLCPICRDPFTEGNIFTFFMGS